MQACVCSLQARSCKYVDIKQKKLRITFGPGFVDVPLLFHVLKRRLKASIKRLNAIMTVSITLYTKH